MNTQAKLMMRNLQIHEYSTYYRWLYILKSNSSEGLNLIKNSQLTYIFGSQITLLSIKFAQGLLHANSNQNNNNNKQQLKNIGLIVSVLTDELAIDTHLSLISSKQLVNNLLCRSKVCQFIHLFF